ncbi:HIRAN domain-containing protein [Calothrix rhizosoleniae]|uniref:HIRAN domain-containing protein n=1 Tax=Calothrix rhizosoleniae TaxID=888997 RepID=UPI000B49C6B4|nr:HIRAN domain-containing protein [Calothrix rhizosoleniae]
MKTLFLAWQDPKSRSWFPIGRLTFNGNKYEFVYTYGAKKAQSEHDFQLLYSFPELDKVYTSTELFPLFSNRVMRRSRPDYKNYLECLNIPEGEDDPIAILSRSGGRKVTDHFEIFPYPKADKNGLYHIHFFAHGLRYFPECAIECINQLQTGEPLYLTHDFQNPYDPHALLLRTEDKHNVGYCPRYLVHDFFQIIRQNPELVKVHAERVNQAPTPLKLRLLCNITTKWHEGFTPFSSEEYQPMPPRVATRTMNTTDIPTEYVNS